MLTDFADLYSISKRNPMLIEMEEIKTELIQVAIKQVLRILPQRDDYNYDIDKNVYFRLLDKAAQAWKDSFRKVEKFKNGNNDNIFKKFDEDTKVILRDILKSSQNYNDLDMLDHTILFVGSLGLSKMTRWYEKQLQLKTIQTGPTPIFSPKWGVLGSDSSTPANHRS